MRARFRAGVVFLFVSSCVASCGGSGATTGVGADGGAHDGAVDTGTDGTAGGIDGGADACAAGSPACSSCRGDSDCAGAAPASLMTPFCLPLGMATCGGLTPPTVCVMDRDCPAGGVCAIKSCYAGPLLGIRSLPACAAKCTKDTDCADPSLACTTDGHCVLKSCMTDGDCPANFKCNLEGCATCTGGQCGRRECTKDSDCAGACVNRACYGGAGTCTTRSG
jgi:hypothetical protein